ncbi:NAD+ synthase [Patescibacteria group bacterium]|nr:NAD+ synthase [Patescibacteria group bacterium]MBU1472183.1 NAD+ synthase [Patescibacteria group bacterium]MBU2459577.1 NAD+ synthase [Patescibacteria group bacterium]MBU2544182.1 NAD+ synthase [Patescibacteria group bacterium]
MLEINAEQTAAELTDFLKASFQKEGFGDAVIALSGGVDSAVSSILAARALGPDHVFPLLLPYGALNKDPEKDALSVVAVARIQRANISRIYIEQLVDAVCALDPSMDKVRRGNIMARVRMTLLFDAAKRRKALVVGTENKSEYLLGYYTRFGDEASDIEPLRNIYKTQVYQLARHLGVPQQILLKRPSAGLWEGQTDEGEFGFSYQDADEVLHQLYDEKNSTEQILKSGINKEALEKISNWMERNSFKHRVPIIPSTPAGGIG